MFAIFLVIQHSTLEIQEKYYPMMKQATIDETLQLQTFAMLDDRIRLKKGLGQLYGTQMGYDTLKKRSFVQPIENPERLDFRRALVNLNPMKEYWLKWDLELYYKELPYYEELLRQSVESHK